MNRNLLTDKEVKNFKSDSSNNYRVADGNGLYIEVRKTGKKIWKYSFTCNHKKGMVTLGHYPTMTLAQARQEREKYKSLCLQGINPVQYQNDLKNNAIKEENRKKLESRTFSEIVDLWKTTFVLDRDIKKKTKDTKIRRLEIHAVPYIGNKVFIDVNLEDLRDIIMRIYKKNHTDLAFRVKQILKQLFKWATAFEYCKNDLSNSLDIICTNLKPVHKPRPCLQLADNIGELLRKIDNYDSRGRSSMSFAIKIMPYVAVRSIELRGALKSEIDFEKNIWTIPADRMKMKKEHIVPLAPQVARLFKEACKFSKSRYIFPSRRTYISAEGLMKILRVLGYNGVDAQEEDKEMSIHGFRAMFSTLMNETGLFDKNIIEKQLAHSSADKVLSAYDRSNNYKFRRILMEQYANLLDGLREGKSFEEIVETLKPVRLEMKIKE